MGTTRFVALRCRISRGGFSDERVFSLAAVEHEGIASRRHLWNHKGQPLEEGEPPLGEVIDGFVAARVLEKMNQDQALVSIPDGEAIMVPASALVERPQGADKHVSV